jgi:HPt (histidine-containing phosphotransfer) domain-containing protein
VSDTHIIDRSKLDGLRQELGSNFSRILGYFREDGVKSIAAIEEAIRQGSAVAIVRPAHTLKGESLQFGAIALGAMAEQIEMAARRAVEDHVFPIDVVEYAVNLRPLFEEATTLLARETAVTAPIRRAVGGFGRKVATGF